MKNINGQLRWTQPSVLKMNYELRAAEEVAATLRFRSMLGTLATAESADGCWTFKRVGFLQARATIRSCGSDTEIASFQNNTWSGGGTLKLADGRTLLATTNFWRTHLEIQTEAGEVLLRLQTTGFWGTSADLSITPAGRNFPELAWVNLFAWYLIVLIQADAAAV